MKTWRAEILSVIVLLLLPATLLGQGQAVRRNVPRVPVTVVLVDQLPVSGESYLVQRRPSIDPHDVILLRPGVTVEQFSEAVATLLVSRQATGDLPEVAGYVRVRAHGGAKVNRRVFPWAQRILADLAAAQPSEVEGIGRVQAVKIWLPPQHRIGLPAQAPR